MNEGSRILRGNSEWGSLGMPSVLAAAHELKAPLVLIRQLSYQLENDGEMSQTQSQASDRIRMTAERALRLVENITRTANLDDAMFALEPVQVAGLWHDVMDETALLTGEHQQTVRLSVPRKAVVAIGHRELLRATLLGLYDNALAHNPHGGTIRLSAKRQRGRVVLSIRDEGPKIDAKSYKTLEYRLGKSAQPIGARPGSSGLGLWIAGVFARAMSAELTVTRHRRGGMTFSLDLPASGQLSLI